MQIKQCQQHCMSLLKKDPTNEGASMILARVMARKGNTEAAIAYFKPLLNRPHNPSVAALEEVVGLLYRSGRLDEVASNLGFPLFLFFFSFLFFFRPCSFDLGHHPSPPPEKKNFLTRAYLYIATLEMQQAGT